MILNLTPEVLFVLSELSPNSPENRISTLQSILLSGRYVELEIHLREGAMHNRVRDGVSATNAQTFSVPLRHFVAGSLPGQEPPRMEKCRDAMELLDAKAILYSVQRIHFRNGQSRRRAWPQHFTPHR